MFSISIIEDNISGSTQTQDVQDVTKLDSSQINHPDETSTGYTASIKGDVNNLNKLKVHDSLKTRSNNEEIKNDKEFNNSEKRGNTIKYWVAGVIWIGLSVALFFIHGKSSQDGDPYQGFKQYINYKARCDHIIQNVELFTRTLTVIGIVFLILQLYLIFIGNHGLFFVDDEEYPLEPQVFNDRDPNSNIITRSQINSHNYDKRKLSKISKSSLLPPDDSYDIITTDQLETPEHRELKNKGVCLICLESYDETHNHIVQLPCAHSFHYKCFVRLRKVKGNRTDFQRPSMICCICTLSLIKYHQYLVDYELDHKQVEFINK
ncbi:putative RING finger protein [Wickerhamomyces ciferrii]|uniref:RING finger protein n=1 Tax=Wickerhamomyces ciferrii (strain ATCC 14091 / BCRC 22168 / CBS 111 / JCM 3599 / NBRC 0793 / NRRL Y-1031 F-60-10) TaxID=1206466 RepID=K0KI96_WICCF|nr:putative RING finger protein [Wickerhamomyces ciferrii]CCH41887.1 putative RING finger protein [Wickerhamomyces ciferrii]